MDSFKKHVEVRWSDLDPNFHLRHSVYYDWGAYVRMSFFTENNITPSVMQQYHIGPILFREECVFKREIAFGDEVLINLLLSAARNDSSRWSMQHEVWKNGNTLAAVITIDGAWIDTQLRKLAQPPAIFAAAFEAIPKSPNFIMLQG